MVRLCAMDEYGMVPFKPQASMVPTLHVGTAYRNKLKAVNDGDHNEENINPCRDSYPSSWLRKDK